MAIRRDEFIFGIHAVQEALAAGRTLDKVWMDKAVAGGTLAQLKGRLRDAEVQVQFVPLPKIESLARGKNHQGVLAFLSLVDYQPLEEIVARVFEAGQVPLLVLLDGVTDVRNLGAIARTAECMGAHALIVPAEGSARINADAVKTSAGALSHLPVCRERNLKKTITVLKASGVAVAACTEKAELTLQSLEARAPLCLVFGDEGAGISDTLLRQCDRLVKIPMTGRVASLNVSVAAGMALYEVIRQRRQSK